MASLFLTTLALLMVAVSGSHSGLSSSELYWKAVLPKTPIPNIIQDLMTSSVEKKFSIKGIHPNRVQIRYNGIWSRASILLHDDPNKADFILEKDLHQGTTMALHMQRTIQHTGFLPREAADSIPFSSTKLPEIITRFNVQPNSNEAKIMKEELETCESKGVDGEQKLCATSVESMVDFASSTVGTTHLLALSTTGAVGKAVVKNQEYTIVSPGARRVAAASSKSVTCHPTAYPYAMYYCHLIRSTKVYEVSLVGKDGSRVRAVVACHTDTTSWNPMHLAFQVLKVKPGTVPICHFLPEDNVIFAPGN